jgi:hypothetical protein
MIISEVDANKYAASVKAIEGLLKDKDDKERSESISSIAVATSVPIIAVILIVIDLFGPQQSLYDMLSRMMRFYKVDRAFYKDEDVRQYT